MQFSENSVLLNFYGGHKAVARPDPIPNSAVKHRIADGSACIACARVGCRRTFLITPFSLLTVFSDSGLGVIYFTRNVVHCLVFQRRNPELKCSCFELQKSRGKSQQSNESSNLRIYGDFSQIAAVSIRTTSSLSPAPRHWLAKVGRRVDSKTRNRRSCSTNFKRLERVTGS